MTNISEPIQPEPAPVNPYYQDGHVFSLVVAHGGLMGEIHCPGEGKCKAWVEPSGTRPAFCNLKDWFGAVGWHEFAEDMQEKADDGTPREARLPCEIEWRMTGWDDGAELWWRPVEDEAPLRTNLRHAMNAIWEAGGGAIGLAELVGNAMRETIEEHVSNEEPETFPEPSNTTLTIAPTPDGPDPRVDERSP